MDETFQRMINGTLELAQQVRAEFPTHDLSRVEKLFAARMRMIPPYNLPMQEPELLCLPDMSKGPIYRRPGEPSSLEWVDALERAAPIIREDARRALDIAMSSFTPYAGESPELREKFAECAESWRVFEITSARGREVCPATAKLFDDLFPEDYFEIEPRFSMLEPGAHIPAHHGQSNHYLVLHVGLLGLSGCRMRVADQTIEWQEGRCLIFEDSFEHEVWHEGDEIRVVLLAAFWRPEINPAERALIERLETLWGSFPRRSRNAGAQSAP
jgi:aspartate beta-hydroxylase